MMYYRFLAIAQSKSSSNPYYSGVSRIQLDVVIAQTSVEREFQLIWHFFALVSAQPLAALIAFDEKLIALPLKKR